MDAWLKQQPVNFFSFSQAEPILTISHFSRTDKFIYFPFFP